MHGTRLESQSMWRSGKQWLGEGENQQMHIDGQGEKVTIVNHFISSKWNVSLYTINVPKQ